MEDELRTAPPSFRNAMSTKLRMYRRDLGKLQRDMKTSTSGFGFSRLPDEGGRGIYSSENQQSVSFEGCSHLWLDFRINKEGSALWVLGI